MRLRIAITLVVGALGLAGCAATDTKTAPAGASAKSAGLLTRDEDSFRTGSRIPVKPPESQPVKAINNADWKSEQHEKPQPLPAGS